MFSEEKAYSFSVPAYFPSPKELESIIQKNGYFTIETSSELKTPLNHTAYSAEFHILHIRAAMEGLITKHFGDEFVDEIFNYFNKKAAENLSVFDPKSHKNMVVFIVLKRISAD